MGRSELSVLSEPCPLDAAAVERIVRAAATHGGQPELSVGVVMAPDSLMVELHGTYLDDPTPTDVITFDLRAGEDDFPLPPGEADAMEAGAALDAELYVGVEEAQRVAERRGVSLERELALYVAHGVLHLVGFDDLTEDDAAAMRVAEHAVMASLGYPPDTLPHHA